MCGVIGFICEREMSKLGELAMRLLKMLEYRGYDSTGAAIQDSGGNIVLRKDVGAPSIVGPKLGIPALSGQVFCGQVRWATFGVVTKENAQPHEVACHTHIYGAHNGNITNCQQLKDWLISEGHDVKSDNDGEMLIHTIEHFFAAELRFKDPDNHEVRRQAMKNAVLLAFRKVTGSFAAVIVDPVIREITAIKAGSSLYIGKGNDPDGGDFFIASSDLASVLQITRILLPIKEKQAAVFRFDGVLLYDLLTGGELAHTFNRSLLKVEETKLQHPYKYFMEQEIASQSKASARLISLFTGGNEVTRLLRKERKKLDQLFLEVRSGVIKMASITSPAALREESERFFRSESLIPLRKILEKIPVNEMNLKLESSYATFLEEIREQVVLSEFRVPGLVKLIDSIFELEDVLDIEQRMKTFVRIVVKAHLRGNNIYMLACGTSFHAAKTAPVFFNEVAGFQIIPLLPGEFRAQCTRSLRHGDVVIGISQSGETKDLIDIFNFIESSGKQIQRICILNNTNSTLAMEKSHLYIPLFCGPEIAVPATKSFINQLMVLYLLAIRVQEQMKKTRSRKFVKDEIDHLQLLRRIPELIDRTIKTTGKETDEIARELFLAPSIHILATRLLGVAKEGALKIREVVLNHTEGFEGSEFKHGPNTLLGVNTVFGLSSIESILRHFDKALCRTVDPETGLNLTAEGVYRLFHAFIDYAFRNNRPDSLTGAEEEHFRKVFIRNDFFASMYTNYPLVFVVPPQEQDVQLTISQVNTHKIRGADIFMIAEDNALLREAVSIPPAGDGRYRHGYVTLPRTDSSLLSIFSATVVLQLLALKMSRLKMRILDRFEITGHGVHPDVPKNVSKSITVD